MIKDGPRHNPSAVSFSFTKVLTLPEAKYDQTNQTCIKLIQAEYPPRSTHFRTILSAPKSGLLVNGMWLDEHKGSVRLATNLKPHEFTEQLIMWT